MFALLTKDVPDFDYPQGKQVFITARASVVSKGSVNPMPMTDHEEADTRICLHVEDALQNGETIIMVMTVDLDIVVILAGIFL